jgi:NAD(P)-dependent dehydrogenase (short-subunit alcohol dehydrogenase family)
VARLSGFACDLGDAQAISELAGTVGDIDHLVLSAAVPVAGPFLEMPVEHARRFLDNKFWGYYLTVRAFAPALSKHGSIVMFSGNSVVRPSPGTAIIAAVNAAIEGLTRALAVELAPLRVNAVRPGVVDTPAWARVSEEDRAELFQVLSESLPVGRVGKPADVATAVLELVNNGFSTGDVRTVDGGARLA